MRRRVSCQFQTLTAIRAPYFRFYSSYINPIVFLVHVINSLFAPEMLTMLTMLRQTDGDSVL